MAIFNKDNRVPLSDDDNTGHEKPQAMRRVRLGVGQKAALVLAVAIFAGFAIQLALQTMTMSDRALERTVARSVAMTELLASQISGAIKWKKSDVVGRAYGKLASDPQSDLSNLAAFHMSGEKVSEFNSDKLQKFDVTTAELFAKDASEAKTNVVVTGSHIVVTAPVLTREL